MSVPILDECFRSILANRADLSAEARARTQQLMTEAVPDCMVSGFEDLIDSLDLPDLDDRHVLAAAIRVGAQAIVTFNLRDFPAEELSQYDLEAKHPDDFVLEMIDLGPGRVVEVLTQQANALKNPPTSIPALLDTLRETGLVQSVARLRELFGVGAMQDPFSSS